MIHIGTNFYLRLKDLPIDERLKQFIECNEIHIAKTSYGWKPLFERQLGRFSTIKELKQYYEDNSDMLEIIDEYDKAYTWDEFDKRVLQHGNEDSYSHLEYHGKDITGNYSIWERLNVNNYIDCDGFEWQLGDFC